MARLLMMRVCLRRSFSTTSYRCITDDASYLHHPTPTDTVAKLNTPELRALADKATGSWKGLSKEETVTLYRATFAQSLAEIKKERRAIWSKTFALSAAVIVVSLAVGEIITYFVGPKPPVTYNNPQWEEDKRKRLLKQKANPIFGISSKANE